MTRIEAAAETARPVAVHLIEAGAPCGHAIRFAAMFAAFIDKNGDLAAEMIREGHDPEHVADEFLIAFRRFLDNQKD